MKLTRWMPAWTRRAKTVNDARVAAPTRQTRELLDAEPWIIESFSMDQKAGRVRIEMRGWALPDATRGGASPGKFSINGRPFDSIEYPLKRDDIAAKMWMRASARYSGFHCVAEGSREELFQAGAAEIAYHGPGPGPRIAAQQHYYFLDPEAEGPAPPQAARYRVVGNNSLIEFQLAGYTDARKLDAAAEAVDGRGLAHRRILDWGCGCGRLARYMSQFPGVELSGCDIDRENVAWCADHLKGRFELNRMRPPLPFADSSFDLVYGVSVFTHLREPLQDAWLYELHRVSAPGALILMTIHGPTALDYCGVAPEGRAALEPKIGERGICESSVNDQLDSFAEHEGEYVNVFHHPGYIRSHWGGTFEILDILPGYIFTHDVVVMRKRP